MSISITIRDLKDSAAVGIDLAARAAGVRSREAFLRSTLEQLFGDQNVTLQISMRFREAVEALFALVKRYQFDSTFCVAELAQLLGHRDTATLEAELRGEVPLSFQDGDRFCDLVGLNRAWLLTGKSTPYDTRSKYRDSTELFRDIYRNGTSHIALFFVLSNDDRGTAAVYGQTPYRYDRLIDDVPIHDDLRGGQHEFRDFCLFLASIGHTVGQEAPLKRALIDPGVPTREISLIGRVLDEADLRNLLDGAVHPAAILKASTSSPWHEDLYDLEYRGNTYSANFVRARAFWRASMSAQDITTNEQLIEHVNARLVEWQPGDLEIARMLQSADTQPSDNLDVYSQVVAKARESEGDERMRVRELFWNTRVARPAWIEFEFARKSIRDDKGPIARSNVLEFPRDRDMKVEDALRPPESAT
jgi:hypothetical protein